MNFDDNLVKVVTVLAPVVLSLIVYLTGRQAKRSADKAEGAAARVESTLAISDTATATKLNEIHSLEQTIHVLVNSRLSEALAKIDRLEAKLFAETGEVPTGEPPPASLTGTTTVLPPDRS